MLILAWTIGLLALLSSLYALHRLALYLEQRDLIYYWHKRPTGGSSYNPLQEFSQPQIRHVIEVSEQRIDEAAKGAPPFLKSPGPSLGTKTGGQTTSE